MHNDTRLRLCITCRQLIPRNQLWALTVNRDNQFSVNGNPPLQGRSAYVCRTLACLNEAIRTRKFQRTLKRAIPDAIVESLQLEVNAVL